MFNTSTNILTFLPMFFINVLLLTGVYIQYNKMKISNKQVNILIVNALREDFYFNIIL